MIADWVTIRSFTYPEEAYILRSRLEAEGINVNLLNELTVQSYNFISNAVGGVKLQVLREDLDRVRELLGEEVEEEASYDPVQDEVLCTHCGSNDVRRHRYNLWSFIVGLFLLGIPFFIRSASTIVLTAERILSLRRIVFLELIDLLAHGKLVDD